MAQQLFGLDKLVLQLDDAFAGAEAQFEFVHIERLLDIVVGAGLEAGEDLFDVSLAGKEDDVHVSFVGVASLTDLLAYLKPAQAGHHPIEQGQTWVVFSAEIAPGHFSVFGGNDFVTALAKGSLEHEARCCIVFGNQYAQCISPIGAFSRRARAMRQRPV